MKGIRQGSYSFLDFIRGMGVLLKSITDEIGGSMVGKQKIKKNKEKNKVYIGIFFFGTVLIYMIFSCIHFFTKTSYDYIVANYGGIHSLQNIKGVVVRDEDVIISPSEGVPEFYYHEGEKVKRNIVLCNILDESTYAILQNRIQNIDAQIASTANMEGSELDNDLNEIQQDMIDSFNLYSMGRDFSGIRRLKKNLEYSMNKRNHLFSLEDNPMIQELTSEKEDYGEQLDHSAVPIIFDKGGIISYYVDGYESLDINSITEAQIQDIFDADIEGTYINENTVGIGDPLGKIVDNYSWNIIAIFPPGYDENLQEGQWVPLELSQPMNESLESQIIGMEQGEKGTILRFLVKEKLDRFLDTRVVNISITLDDTKGIKIPNYTITEKQFYKIPKKGLYESRGNIGIFALGQDGQEFIPIEYVQEDDDYVYGLPEQEEQENKISKILIQTDDEGQDAVSLEMSQNIQGVYIINNGYKKFRRIEVLSGNQDYSIIDANTKYGVQLYDRVFVPHEPSNQ